MVEAANRELAGVDYQIKVKIGDPAEAIIAMEKELNADLVVIATHGRRGVRRLVLAAEMVVRESTIPVLTIRTLAN
jgi:nucleotide-binding universal stress UspA family protein